MRLFEQLLRDLDESYSLLRSALSIAERRGQNVDWDRFLMLLRPVVDRHHTLALRHPEYDVTDPVQKGSDAP